MVVADLALAKAVALRKVPLLVPCGWSLRVTSRAQVAQGEGRAVPDPEVEHLALILTDRNLVVRQAQLEVGQEVVLALD